MVRSGVVITSLALTVLIFALGVLLNYALDFVRIGTIAGVMSEHELGTYAYLVEQEFAGFFGGDRCTIMNNRIGQLKEEVRKVGIDLSSYGSFSFFKKRDYDYLKRKYFLLELRFLALIEQLNKDCNRPYIPILFFYEIDDDASERQGFILEDLSKAYKKQVVVLALDKDYEDEPLIRLLVAKYNVSTAPTLVIGDEKREGIVFEGELNATVNRLLRRADPFGKQKDFTYVLKAAGRNITEFAFNLSLILGQNLSDLARAETMLVLGRISNNDSLICDSLEWYDRALNRTVDVEQQALLYETIASLDCGRNTRAFLSEAAARWKLLGNNYRAELFERLVQGRPLKLVFDESQPAPLLSVKGGASGVVIGETGIVLKQGDFVLSQADRVKRDWLGLQLNNSIFGEHLLTTFSERLWYNESELRPDIGWHEGGRMSELVKAGIRPMVAYGTLAARNGNRWYAVDDKGVFAFEVPLDKVLYPTTRFLRDNVAVLIDTHGVNMLVEQAIRNNVAAVLSDCDHPGKTKAALYLSNRNISVACFPDKFVWLALGHNASLIGSPPVRSEAGKIVIGRQPIRIKVGEPVVVMNSTSWPYALWYYQSPASYFVALQEALPGLNLTFVQVADFNQMESVVRKADELGASVIAARVFNSDDYHALKEWLVRDQGRRVVLFHSASYPYGYLLLKELPEQVGFDDPNPRFV